MLWRTVAKLNDWPPDLDDETQTGLEVKWSGRNSNGRVSGGSVTSVGFVVRESELQAGVRELIRAFDKLCD